MVGLSIRRNLSRGYYVEASGSYTRAFRLEYLGSDRWSTSLKLGYDF